MGLLETPIAFLSTQDAERAITFYRDILGFSLIADEPFALVFDMGRVELRIQKVESAPPSQGTMLGWQVNDLEFAVTELTSLGIEFEDYPHLEQDAHGIWTSPAGARVAWFRDPCGQLLSITMPPSA